ncbi:hypothetical protein BDP55DRAFT_654889 [Colletotrichum godetiae]|uniref:Uncharacterized protein n=1 Tax=Colletotrichum godetiae TaxID=1209918 RepID=A0AAJ0ATK6_9PEZI|nr:uncharacterized protein BDP55DRAFT_654889 [Colletotrichum godetiae]KAK1688696.1 hypothetical protein BDP55DRAFT_654889 [Colletotrichum godetiae]
MPTQAALGLGWRLAFGVWRFESPPTCILSTVQLLSSLSIPMLPATPRCAQKLGKVISGDIGGKNSSLWRLSLASFADHSSRLDLDGSHGQAPVMDPGKPGIYPYS